RFPESTVALLGSCALFFVPANNGQMLLNWKEAAKIDCGTLLLFGSGISLGQMMFSTGLTESLGNQLPFNQMPFALALLLLVFVTIFATELMSNTAAANLLIPLVISTAPFNEYPVVSVMSVCLASSMAFMLPVGTPPNAIIFGTGKVQLSWMLRKGIWLNLICLSLIWLLGQWLF